MRITGIIVTVCFLFLTCACTPANSKTAISNYDTSTASQSVSDSQTPKVLSVTDMQTVTDLCNEHININYTAELLGDIGDPAPLLSEGLISDYVTAKSISARNWIINFENTLKMKGSKQDADMFKIS